MANTDAPTVTDEGRCSEWHLHLEGRRAVEIRTIVVLVPVAHCSLSLLVVVVYQ
jgi:hypothetical protein